MQRSTTLRSGRTISGRATANSSLMPSQIPAGKGVTNVWLEVRESNQKAILFMRKTGLNRFKAAVISTKIPVKMLF